ncbi:MAG: serine/threonine protein kinase [Myxococcales bacterium]|nr:serine/threonine protein kinase [Myxococcales bacterium]
MTDSLIGTRLGNFELTSRLGSGGMGDVYAGTHAILGHHVAVKLMRPALLSTNPEHAVQRFITEARALTQIDSAHVIRLHDFGRMEGGALYYVMEHLEGHDLEHELAGRLPLSPREALVYIEQIAAGLGAAHRQGIVHRDLKPANVFVCPGEDGRPFTLKVIDFGIAKDLSTEQQITVGALGTPFYAAPEQVAGEAVSAATDIYALGVMLYQMLTGELPFEVAEGTSPIAILLAALEKPPISATQRVPSLPPALSGLLDRCLAKVPSERPASADALFRELREIVAPAQLPPTVVAPAQLPPTVVAPTPTPTATPTPTPTPTRGRAPLLVAAALLVVACVVVGVVLVKRGSGTVRSAAGTSSAVKADTSPPGRALEAPSRVHRTSVEIDAAVASAATASDSAAKRPVKKTPHPHARPQQPNIAAKKNKKHKKSEPQPAKSGPRPKTKKRTPLIDSDDVLPP